MSACAAAVETSPTPMLSTQPANSTAKDGETSVGCSCSSPALPTRHEDYALSSAGSGPQPIQRSVPTTANAYVLNISPYAFRIGRHEPAAGTRWGNAKNNHKPTTGQVNIHREWVGPASLSYVARFIPPLLARAYQRDLLLAPGRVEQG